ncbi:hypothetical protein J6590_035874, partial [Homalodisca vitripennis]
MRWLEKLLIADTFGWTSEKGLSGGNVERKEESECGVRNARLFAATELLMDKLTASCLTPAAGL